MVDQTSKRTSTDLPILSQLPPIKLFKKKDDFQANNLKVGSLESAVLLVSLVSLVSHVSLVPLVPQKYLTK